MELTKRMKVALGLLTVWPLCYMLLFFLRVLLFMFAASDVDVPDYFELVVVVHFFTAILILCLIAFYMVYLIKTTRVEAGKKALWAVVILLGHVVGMPIFFLMHVWPEGQAQSHV